MNYAGAATLIQDPATGLMRFDPGAPPDAYGTHGIVQKMRPASCQEYECRYWETGFYVRVDPNIQMGPERLLYIRNLCGRRFKETVRDDGMHVFYFYPHQSCFETHRLAATDERFYWRGGDWRGNPTGERTILRPADWVDHFQTDLGRWTDSLERG
jgi:hypothetical protein